MNWHGERCGVARPALPIGAGLHVRRRRGQRAVPRITPAAGRALPPGAVGLRSTGTPFPGWLRRRRFWLAAPPCRHNEVR